MSKNPTNGITFVETGEMCPTCDIENIINVDYREVVKILKGEADANLPLIHCKECGNRLAPCSMCTDAINDGIIAEEERNCFDCPITKYWNAKFGEDKHGEDDMTEEKKTPSLDEIVESFNNKCHCGCDNDYVTDDCRPCDYCKFLHPDYDTLEWYQKDGWVPGCDGSWDTQGSCERLYIYEVATGARDINKPLWNPPKTPEWFKVGAKLWRKAYSDWYTITALKPKGFDDDDGEALFAVEMVASDGSEDKETLTSAAFVTEAPFSESFRNLFFKRRALHKRLGLVVEITDYIYEDNEVHFSYYNKDGVSISATEELHEGDFEAVKTPSWLKIGQWVKHRDELAPSQVTAIADGKIYIETAGDGLDDWIGAEDFDNIEPVKFRPYESIEELEALIGKKLRIKREVMGGGSLAVETITSVEYDSFDGETIINLRPYSFYTKEATTTIDGLPIGVPVVDEELLSNP